MNEQLPFSQEILYVVT